MQPSENGHGQHPPTRIMPRCGYCKAGEENGAPLAAMPLQMGDLHCILIFCGNPACGAIHTVNVMAVAGPPSQQPSNLIAIPGRL